MSSSSFSRSPTTAGPKSGSASSAKRPDHGWGNWNDQTRASTRNGKSGGELVAPTIYLPDTNAWITYLKRPTSPLASKLVQTSASQVRLCSVVLGELFYGAYKGSHTPA